MASTGHSWTGKRWSADTEIAFLLALKLTGNVSAACREIGRSTHGATERRNRDPDFAAKWQKVLEEQHWMKIAAEKAKLAAIDPDELATGSQAEEGEMPNRTRYDGFTPLRQRAFLRALAETGRIEKACKLAGISPQAARNMRKRYPSFAAAWDRALAKAEPTLEQIAVDRAVNGVSEPVYHGGEVVGHRKRYSDSLMRDVLKREDERLGTHKTPAELVADAQAAAHAAGGTFSTRASIEEVRASLMTKLAALARRNAPADAFRYGSDDATDAESVSGG